MSEDQLSTADLANHQPATPPALSALVEDYLTEYQQGIDYDNQASISPIEVDELASKLAKLYEKIRRIVDWKEENLVRRTAIERILKRSLLTELSGLKIGEGLNPEKITEPLVMEMVRSGYFTNGRISKNKIPLAKASLEKYIYLLNHSSMTAKTIGWQIKEKVNFYNWILEIAACEIEEVLAPAFRENALINCMTNSVSQKLKVTPADQISPDDQMIQIYIAVHRTLFGLDEPIITYNLIKYRYPGWFSGDPQFLTDFANQIDQVKPILERDIELPMGREFFKVCDTYDAAYLLLGDVMKELEKEDNVDFAAKLADRATLNQLVEQAYQNRYQTLKARLTRSAIYSTLSIFATGIVSFIIFEGPVARMVNGEFSWFALLVDLGIPSLLMFILVAMIKMPPAENLARVKIEVAKIVRPSTDHDVYEINLAKRKPLIANAIFAVISTVAGISAAIGIYWLFKIAGVPWTSIYIDTINVAMIIFAAMVIRHKSKEITIEEGGSFSSMLLELFSLPLAKIGQWFSQKWKEYNILSVFFTALVDTPFSALLGIFEDWRTFLRDKRSEIH